MYQASHGSMSNISDSQSGVTKSQLDSDIPASHTRIRVLYRGWSSHVFAVLIRAHEQERRREIAQGEGNALRRGSDFKLRSKSDMGNPGCQAADWQRLWSKRRKENHQKAKGDRLPSP